MASKAEIDTVWEKGATIPGKDPALYRKDPAGNVIYKPAYGKQGPQSWEIDHKKPVAHGGPDTIKNKQPLQTQANREKGASSVVTPGPGKPRGR
jgi:hypothetical protein